MVMDDDDDDDDDDDGGGGGDDGDGDDGDDDDDHDDDMYLIKTFHFQSVCPWIRWIKKGVKRYQFSPMGGSVAHSQWACDPTFMGI